MTVFVLHVDTDDSHHFEGVFSTREKAEAAACEAHKIYGHTDIKEEVVDELCGKVAVLEWTATIDLTTGELQFDPDDGSYRFNEPTEYVWDHDLTNRPGESQFDTIVALSNTNYCPSMWRTHSRVSQDDARELAKTLFSDLVASKQGV